MSPCVVEQSRINLINVSHPNPTSVKVCVTSIHMKPNCEEKSIVNFKTNFQRWNSFQVQHIFHPWSKFAKQQPLLMLACQRLSSNINSGGRPHNLESLWSGQHQIFLCKIIWKCSPIGDKNKSNETYYIKGFGEKEKMHQGCWISRIFFCWSCNM